MTTTPPVMDGQLAFPTLVTPERIVGATIQQRFEAFHSKNPWLLVELEKLAIQMGADRGRKMSIETLVGKIRWDYDIATKGDAFKINDHFTSRYVRLMIERHPAWADVFTLRRVRAA